MKEKIKDNKKVYGIVGYPIKHSFSPIMQNAAFSELKIDAIYIPFLVKPENISQALDKIRVEIKELDHRQAALDAERTTSQNAG